MIIMMMMMGMIWVVMVAMIDNKFLSTSHAALARYEGQYLDDMQHGYGVAMYVPALN